LALIHPPPSGHLLRYFTLLRGAGFTSQLSLPTWGSMWMGQPACPLHRPTTYSRQMGSGRGGRPSCQASSCLVTAVGGDAFPEDVKPPGLDIRWSVNRMATCAIGSYMEHIIFTRTRLPYVRVIMVFMRVPMVEPLSQTVMGWTPTLECMLSLSGVHGLLLSRPISPSDKYHPLVRP
jgi:hypothetical protein